MIRPEMADHVAYLQTMTIERLAAYCTSVLEFHVGRPLAGADPSATDDRYCDHCGNHITVDLTGIGGARRRRYCNKRCQVNAYNARRRQRLLLEQAVA